MVYGRQILQRWYDEAWNTHQENMQLINRLENMANQDALTATANRRALDNFLAQAWERKEPLALIILDVDFFKRITTTTVTRPVITASPASPQC